MKRSGNKQRERRAPAGWLRGKAAAFVLSFDVDAEAAILAAGCRYAGHAMVMTHQAYGPLVGVPNVAPEEARLRGSR